MTLPTERPSRAPSLPPSLSTLYVSDAFDLITWFSLDVNPPCVCVCLGLLHLLRSTRPAARPREPKGRDFVVRERIFDELGTLGVLLEVFIYWRLDVFAWAVERTRFAVRGYRCGRLPCVTYIIEEHGVCVDHDSESCRFVLLPQLPCVEMLLNSWL